MRWSGKLALMAHRRADVEKFYADLKAWQPTLRADLIAAGVAEKRLAEEEHLTMLEAAAEYAKTNFWFFISEILDWQGLDEEFHGEMTEFLQKKAESKLLLSPRGHLKSTLGTVAYALWRAVKNPECRLLIANYRLDNAKSFLFQIRAELNKERFQAFYPRLVPNLKNVKWNETQLTLKRSSNPKEATFEVTGVGGEITGKHYDVILFDDIVGPENVGTLEQLQKLRTWWGQMQAILEPGGDQVLIGTRYHYADLYGHIIENLQHEFHILKRSVYREDGSPSWPGKFTPEIIKKIEERMTSDPRQGRALFVAQYFNEVIDEATAAFRRDKIRYYAENDVPTALGVTISLDPAISEKETADRSAIVVRGVDVKGNWYILEVWAERGVTPTRLIEKLFELYLKWSKRFPVTGVGIEAQSYQKSLIYAMRDEMTKRQVFLPLIELGNWRTSKELRIRGLIPRFEMGMMFFRKPMESGDQTDILLDEMLRFPKSSHDDVLDALSFHQDMETFASELEPIAESNPDEVREGYDRYGYKLPAATSSAHNSFL